MTVHFKEDFLHYIWKVKLFRSFDLLLSDGRTLEIIDYGSTNVYGGPDFLNVKIKIDGIIWVGNMEIHIKSSEWYNHKHQDDIAYKNVVLHVVYYNDKPVYNSKNDIIPTLELNGKIPFYLIEKYTELQLSSDRIPCGKQISSVPQEVVRMWFYQQVVERLQLKSKDIETHMVDTQNNWEEVAYQRLATYFGNKANREPFLALAKSLPLSIINKNKDNLTKIEALFLGTAGFIPAEPQDTYIQSLKHSFMHLQYKYDISPMSHYFWNFGRVRPPHFPSIRTVQLAYIIGQKTSLFDHIKYVKSADECYTYLDIDLPEYWKTHYLPEQSTPAKSIKLGKSFMDILIINVVVPIKFYYAKYIQSESMVDDALALLEEINPEKNTITQKWASLNIKMQNAMDSQAALQIYHQYCTPKKCLNCAIGHHLIQSSNK